MNVFRSIDKIFCIFGKTAIFLVVGIIAIYICFVVFVYAATWLWPDFYGSYSLGSNLYMLDGDKGRKTIVYGTSIAGNTCYSGDPVIPTSENQYDSLGNFAEYVVDAKADDNWIIAKTDNKLNHRRKYYIINKLNINEDLDAKDILMRHVTIFTDSNEFANKCHLNNINIKW